MAITLYAHADMAALLDNAERPADQEWIHRHHGAYVEHLAGLGVNVDHDNRQTTHCWTWADQWPDNVPTFWDWSQDQPDPTA